MYDLVLEIFEKFVILYRIDELDLENFSDIIADATSDTDFRKLIARKVNSYREFIMEFDFPAIKLMTENEREKLSDEIDELTKTYFIEEIFENRLVTTEAQRNERIRLAAERRKTSPASDPLHLLEKNTEIGRNQDLRNKVLFCEVCGEKFFGWINFDEHLGTMHGQIYLKRFFCGVCAGMWLTEHEHN